MLHEASFAATCNAMSDTVIQMFNKYKTFSVLIYSYINTRVFSHNFEFSQFPQVLIDITIYQYGKNVLYLFYNIAQRNIKKEIFQRFRVDIKLYQHGS
jgi:hypothetical protein